MAVFPPLHETWMVSIEHVGAANGPRFLNGLIDLNAVNLVEADDSVSMSTRWAVTRLTESVVKFRCMSTGEGNRFLDGRASTRKVGLRPMLAAPPSGEWWEFDEVSPGVVSLRSLSKFTDPRLLFLQHLPGQGLGLAPTRNPDHWRIRRQGLLVALECQERDTKGPRFLDGDTAANKLQFCPAPLGRYTGSRWLLHRADDGTATLKSLGEIPGGVRFLNGRNDRRVDLAPAAGRDFPGTRWQVIPVDDHNSDVELGFLAHFRCDGPIGERLGFLNGHVDFDGSAARVELAPQTEGRFTGTLWRVLPAGLYWEPCARFREEPDPEQTVAVRRTFWVGQITGATPIDNRPLINGNTEKLFGVPGVDLGAVAEDDSGRLFIYFGDVVKGERPNGPDLDADLIAFTTDTNVEEFDQAGGGGILLHPIVEGKFFQPFEVSGPNGIGVTRTVEVPSGAYHHSGRMFVFFHIWNAVKRTPQPVEGCYIAGKSDPHLPGRYTEVCMFSPRPRADGTGLGPDNFAGVAPVKVRNADHQWLPPDAALQADEGLVMFGIGYNPKLDYSAVHLAWMPLAGDTPDLNTVQYRTEKGWDARPEFAVGLTGKRPNLTSISAAFLPGPAKWILLHMTADPSKRMNGPVLAWIGTPPFDWSKPFNLFDPCRDRAYGNYMHWPGDGIADADPILQPDAGRPDPAVPGWAYGAFLLNRYTQWDSDQKRLELYYLLSLGSPYQVQVMHTTLDLVTP